MEDRKAYLFDLMNLEVEIGREDNELLLQTGRRVARMMFGSKRTRRSNFSYTNTSEMEDATTNLK
jgi:hypothetical protein